MRQAGRAVHTHRSMVKLNLTGARIMAYNLVNLDALLPRENFDVEAKPVPLNRDSTISLATLRNEFFVQSLRKPDFQRETAHWSPTKVVDLIRSFLDADLIPAIILWQSGPFVFVIDGAHRLSALLAWINDDYGDKVKSLSYFDNQVPADQLRVAERTRRIVNKDIGSFDSYAAALSKPRKDLSDIIQKRLSNLSTHSLTAQWVLSNDPKVAEDSFFKINQAASPIDPTESRIIKARHSANALAARAISRAGGGHQYWRNFTAETSERIAQSGKALYKVLYEPPMDEGYVKSLDVPVAGRGYNQLPFVFDLVNLANNQKITDSTAKKTVKETLPTDVDGSITIKYLDRVTDLVCRITGQHPASMGLHPLVYFYNRSGAFQPVTFFAMVRILEKLSKRGNLEVFSLYRGKLEDFLVEHREGASNIIHRKGSGQRSLPWMQEYFELILDCIASGQETKDIIKTIAKTPEWEFLAEKRGPSQTAESKFGTSFSRDTKSAAIIDGLKSTRRCDICHGFLHRNSIHIDHIQEKSKGGTGEFSNAQPAHPFCDSTYKRWLHDLDKKLWTPPKFHQHRLIFDTDEELQLIPA
jgi:hypothetical protein